MRSLRSGCWRCGGAGQFRVDEADVAAALAAGVDWLVFPKANSVAVVDGLDAMMRRHGGAEVPVLATIESPAGVLDAAAICRHPRLAAINLGSEDFALELGGVPDPDVLRMPKLLVHYAAKAAGKRSLGLLRSMLIMQIRRPLPRRRGRRGGMGLMGRPVCIHRRYRC